MKASFGPIILSKIHVKIEFIFSTWFHFFVCVNNVFVFQNLNKKAEN